MSALPAGSLDVVLGSRNRVKVLRVLYRRDGLSGRRVASSAGIPPSAGKTALEELVEAGFVTSEALRGRKCYRLNTKHPLHQAIGHLYAEEAKPPPAGANPIQGASKRGEEERILRFFGISRQTASHHGTTTERGGQP